MYDVESLTIAALCVDGIEIYLNKDIAGTAVVRSGFFCCLADYGEYCLKIGSCWHTIL